LFSQDYVLRMLRQAAAVLAEALRRRASGRHIEAEQAIEGALEGLTGLPFDLLSRLDDGSLLEHLRSPEGELDLDRLLSVADLTALYAELLAERGLQAESTAAAQRALTLYLEAAFAGQEAGSLREASLAEDGELTFLPLEAKTLQERLQAAAGRLELAALPPDTLFGLYQYYDGQQDYAQSVRVLDLLAQALPGDEVVRQEAQDFYRRLLQEDEAVLRQHGLSRLTIETRLRDF